MAVKLAEGRMTMDDFLSQITAHSSHGPHQATPAMLPGLEELKDMPIDENNSIAWKPSLAR